MYRFLAQAHLARARHPVRPQHDRVRGRQLLPGNLGRNVLGTSPSQAGDVDALQPRCTASIARARSSTGTGSATSRAVTWGSVTRISGPVSTLLGPSLVNSLEARRARRSSSSSRSGILGGVAAALRRGRFTDRAIRITASPSTVVPEFVTAIALIVVFGLLARTGCRWARPGLPVPASSRRSSTCCCRASPSWWCSSATSPGSRGPGAIEAIDADYTRTAYLKGLGETTVIRRHVLRNALLPTIAVIATQTAT